MITAGRRRIRKTDVALASWTDDKALGRARQLYAGCSVGDDSKRRNMGLPSAGRWAHCS